MTTAPLVLEAVVAALMLAPLIAVLVAWITGR